ncbi:unnamed protein product [Adineta ricciae]|uniref:Uncharacterized protein n=1 Tax=Adineta ricciae TaxID=249248 RepID=A0A813UQA1_ADIRI|nr:unnamed protein product [Adineta ricciae]CAF1008280.1 unnamed protein product [Adineta ricciae]
MPHRVGGSSMRCLSSSRAPCPTHAVVAPQPAISAPVGRQPGLFAIADGYHNHDQPAAVTQTTTGPTSQPFYQDSSERYGTDRCNLYQKDVMKCFDEADGDSKRCQGF